jgi:uncharacterized protein YegP (UPF0339 family)
VIKLYLDRDAAGSGWRLVSRTERGADLIARSGSRRPDDAAALAQLALLCDVRNPRIVGNGDGHWQWILPAADGTVAAESPAIYRDRAACQEAYADARRAARVIVGRCSLPRSDAPAQTPA